MLSSRDLIIVLLGIVGSALIVIFLESREYFSKGLEIIDLAIIFIIAISVIITIVYAKFREINKDLEMQNGKLENFSEMLKRAGELVDIKSDIGELKRRLN